MEGENFEKLINEGINSIPKEFLDKLENVALVIEDEPTYAQRIKLRLRMGITLFGLYEGVPLLNRGRGYSGVLPDKIIIFKNPIIRHARDEEDLKEIVKHTVWHEIAHHFGMNEQDVRRAEARRMESRKE